MDAAFEVDLPETLRRRYFYLRVVQVDRATAWIGPWWRDGLSAGDPQAERRSD